ncbi:uncharacterized protein LOC117646281 [Thrips palmi]|uniref:Uncharacterized protein LOC117646281 n=1 Tax=Thrips palmi TaxID=161013 RepID=A0A6P8YZC2_THRPL|nr:uncharacterized protein LOC117646281 [Thrips palmi]
MLGAGLIMGGTLLTIGLGALAAMSGKALMSAMLALGMSLMSAFRGPPRRCRRSDNNGCNNGDGNDNYEIIARPVITHGHTHSAVLHHDPAYPSAGYPGYVRSLVQPDQIQTIQAPATTTVDVTDFARSGATRLGAPSTSPDSDGEATRTRASAWSSSSRSPSHSGSETEKAVQKRLVAGRIRYWCETFILGVFGVAEFIPEVILNH